MNMDMVLLYLNLFLQPIFDRAFSVRYILPMKTWKQASIEAELTAISKLDPNIFDEDPLPDHPYRDNPNTVSVVEIRTNVTCFDKLKTFLRSIF